ncbi:MAG: carboxylating nicotinate-nucleotide diphosphorylase [Gammaproteobacteria bacterium]
MHHPHIVQNVTMALAEDVATGDLTSDLLPAQQTGIATICARESGILCGRPWVDEVFRQIDSNVQIEWHGREGQTLAPGMTVCTLSGAVRSLFTGERIALNFLQTLSGTATVVARYVAQLQGTKTRLLDTRKTLPGLRYGQKYAVRCGGGYNHRMGLFDAMLIKENHIAAAGSLKAAVRQAIHRHPNVMLEVEVETLQQLEEALSIDGIHRLLLDNFSHEELREGVALVNGRISLEASGGITLDNIAAVAATGVDFISVGALTKDVKALDLTLLCQ